jgi:septum formation protein
MLYLASQSPRRRELLQRLGVRFETIDVDVPEVRAPGEPPADYVRRVACEKAAAGLLKLSGTQGAVVLGADTEVVLDGEVFGNPADAAQASDMLRRLSGRTHEVLSVVWCLDKEQKMQAFSITQVEFAKLDAVRIETYLDCGEWQGKAGAYAIQGRAEAFVVRLSGSYSGVMGLPLHETAGLLHRFGIAA